LVVYAGTDRKNCREVIDIALTEMKRVKSEPVPQTELDSAREQVKGKLLMSLESSDSLMTRLAKNMIYMGTPIPMTDVLAGFDAVKAADVTAIANRLFDGECLHLEVMGKTEGIDLAPETLQL
jgi:predicted Zn-dependent peptidase